MCDSLQKNIYVLTVQVREIWIITYIKFCVPTVYRRDICHDSLHRNLQSGNKKEICMTVYVRLYVSTVQIKEICMAIYIKIYVGKWK